MRVNPYRGVVQIATFNWHMYVIGCMCAAVAVAALRLVALPAAVRWFVWGGLAVGATWLAGSLAVSHYVYDRSALASWDWLTHLFVVAPRRWANIHCGFDETSRAMRRLFPRSTGLVLDIFDPRAMTEASIRRARRFDNGAPTAMRAEFTALPVGNGQLDAVFVIFAAHEIRQTEARRRLFGELHRVLAPGGRVVLVEHGRDMANFLAFGPGCWHFLPYREWLRRACETGLAVEREFRCTPFVRLFVFRKECDK